MHELSIALSLVEGVEEEVLKRGGGRVYAVHVKIGPLSGVVREALEFSYELACEGTSLAGSSLVVKDTPIRLDCAQCGGERDAVSVQSLQCADCGTPGRLISGAELELFALEMET